MGGTVHSSGKRTAIILHIRLHQSFKISKTRDNFKSQYQ